MRAIERALSEAGDASLIAQRREVALTGDRETRLEAMCGLIEKALESKARSAAG